MKRSCLFILIFCLLSSFLNGKEAGLIEKIPLEKGELSLSRFIQPQNYFDSVGRQSAILGREDGNSEPWWDAHPAKDFLIGRPEFISGIIK